MTRNWHKIWFIGIIHGNQYILFGKVVLTLIASGQSDSLSHVGPSEFVVRDECSRIPPCNVCIAIRVDNKQKTKRVYLTDGVPGPDQPVKFF